MGVWQCENALSPGISTEQGISISKIPLRENAQSSMRLNLDARRNATLERNTQEISMSTIA
jgi:hypothetical protein